VNGWLEARIKVYEEFIQKVSKLADAKYGTTTTFDVSAINLSIPDMSELQTLLDTPLPKLEWKMPWEYFQVLEDIEWQPGWITASEKRNLYILIGLRVLLFEFLALLLMFTEIVKTTKTYSRPENSLNGVEAYLEDIYDGLVQSVHDTFSWEGWEAMFPGHPWLNLEESEYILREVFISINPRLAKFKNISSEKSNSTKGNKKGIWKNRPSAKDILSWDSRTDKEKYLTELNKTLLKLSKKADKDKQGIIIPEAVVMKIADKVFPKKHIKGKHLWDTPKALAYYNSMFWEISARIGSIQRLAERTKRDESETRHAEILDRLYELEGWRDEDMQEIYNRIDAWLNSGDQGIYKERYSLIIQDIRTLEEQLENDTPSIYEIKTMERLRRSIQSSYDQILQELGR